MPWYLTQCSNLGTNNECIYCIQTTGVDPDYDTAVDDIKATRQELDDYLDKQKQRLSCRVSLMLTACVNFISFFDIYLFNAVKDVFMHLVLENWFMNDVIKVYLLKKSVLLFIQSSQYRFIYSLGSISDPYNL